MVDFLKLAITFFDFVTLSQTIRHDCLTQRKITAEQISPLNNQKTRIVVIRSFIEKFQMLLLLKILADFFYVLIS